MLVIEDHELGKFPVSLFPNKYLQRINNGRLQVVPYNVRILTMDDQDSGKVPVSSCSFK